MSYYNSGKLSRSKYLFCVGEQSAEVLAGRVQ